MAMTSYGLLGMSMQIYETLLFHLLSTVIFSLTPFPTNARSLFNIIHVVNFPFRTHNVVAK